LCSFAATRVPQQRDEPGEVSEARERRVAPGAPAATGESADPGHRPSTDPASDSSREPIVTPGTPAEPPEGRSAGLGRALRIVDAGPRYFYRSALASLAVTCLLAIPISLHVRPPGALPRSQQETIAVALSGLCIAVLLTLAALCWPPGRRGRRLDRIAAPEQRAAVWLALTAWFPLLLVVVYFKARATLPPTVVWLAFGYLDKRWVTSAYLLGVLAPMLLLAGAARVLAAGREHPRNWRSWLSGLAPGRTDATPPVDAPAPRTSLARAAWRGLATVGAARTAAGILTSLAIAWYFYGPPWYLSQPGAGVIGVQESVFLSGFQAISKGAIPYIGPASVQYGPGAQLLSYLYMRHIGTFSVVGFRESWAIFQWVGATILFVVFFLAFGYVRGLVATLLSALIYPALQDLGFLPGGSYGGFFGWSDPLRYVGAIALILLLPAIIRRCPARRGLAGAAALGLLFGATSYLAQENLTAGIAGAVALSALLLLTGTSSFRSVATALLWVLAGFLVVWVPVLAYYAAHGVLARFLHLYFLIPQAVADGYSNTPYGGYQITAAAKAAQARWETFFYALPFILAVLALLVVVQFRPFRVAWEWSRERVALVAVAMTTILLYQGALLRSDAAHLSGTLLITPGLAIMTATVLPRLLGAWRPVTLAVAGAALFAASFLLLPQAAVRPASIRSWAAAPYQDRQRLAAEPAPAAPMTIAGRRVGAGLTTARQCCQTASVPMRDFIAFMNHLHAIIGNRTTYVVSFPSGYPGIVYFVADLTPAPVPIDVHTMVLNMPQYRTYLANFRSSVLPRTGALVTPSLGAAEARYFRDFYPNARVITLTYRDKPLYVLLRRS
jgi:uncharacterized membrane protein (UPF0136 family)